MGKKKEKKRENLNTNHFIWMELSSIQVSKKALENLALNDVLATVMLPRDQATSHFKSDEDLKFRMICC